jgi:hypothetical protein
MFRFDFKSDFLAHFAAHGFVNPFAQLLSAAGNAPQSYIAALLQQHPPLRVANHCARAGQNDFLMTDALP